MKFTVQEFPVKPVSFKGRYYKRIKNSNHQLSPQQISDLLLQSLQISWDSYPFHKATYNDLNEERIIRFIERVNDGGRFILPENPETALSKLKLVGDQSVSNAAMILFSNENLFYNVHVGRFKDPSLIIDDKMINGSLFEVVEETIRFVISHLKVAFEISGETTQRNEIFEYPIPAIRELVLNALIHRDYTSSSDVQIKIYDQKISFFNPGNLYGGLTIEALNTDSYSSQTRNKLIAEAFYLTRDIEKYGSGFIRVRKEISTYETMTFSFNEEGNGFLTELAYSKQKIDSTPTPQTTPQTIPNKQLKGIKKDIVEILIKHPDASREYIATQTNRSAYTIKDHLKWLILNNYIKRVGPDYSGYWEVL
ncbi:MAG: ATP-dependent DNA helicase [Bacteroidetes bacterium]|nr:ATP-dependent DNA helicase [Bacteroidota bacterium]